MSKVNKKTFSFRKFVIITISILLILATGFIAFRVISRRSSRGTQDVKGQSFSSQTLQWSNLDSILVKSHQENNLEGSGLVVGNTSEILYKNYTGNYNDETTIAIASGTKWLTGATIMTLVDEGKLKLDDKAGKYIPELNDGLKANITIAQLLSHTSGLPEDSPCLASNFLTPDNSTLEKCSQEIASSRLTGIPGKSFFYGGASMQVAGRIAEIVSGKKWADLFAEKIATLLKMTNTKYGTFNKGEIVDSNNPRLAGAVKSNIPDYTNFLKMILDCGKFEEIQVISCDSVNLMNEDNIKDAKIVFTPQPDNRDYAIGHWIDPLVEDGKNIQHSSQGAFGFSPWIDTKRSIFGIYLVKNTLKNVRPFVDEMQIETRKVLDTKISDTETVLLTGTGTETQVNRGIIGDKKGNYLITGTFQGELNLLGQTVISKGQNDFFLAKISKDKQLVWLKSFGSSLQDFTFDIAVDGDDNPVVTGMFGGNIDFGSGQNYSPSDEYSAFTAKFDSQGNLSWFKVFDENKMEVGSEIAVDKDNNILSVVNSRNSGSSLDTGHQPIQGEKAILTKYSSNGDLIFSKNFDASFSSRLRGVQSDTAGNILLTGEFQGNINLNQQNITSSGYNVNIFAIKLASNGELIWLKNWSGSGNNYGRGIGSDKESNIYITGTFGDKINFCQTVATNCNELTSNSSSNLFLTKLNPEGTAIWSKSLNSKGQMEGMELEVDELGNSYVIGDFDNQIQIGEQSFVGNIKNSF
jgi:CubicO group peptidase (beta-lactamase class C family)